jgi:transcriptional regulator of acetoin/glycerol metabolism
MNKPFTGIDSGAMDVLIRYSWPGNVREVANAIERALVVGTPPLIRADDLPLGLSEPGNASPGDSLAEIEQAHVGKVLERTGWNITRAAEILQIDRATIYNKIKKYGLRR